MELHHLQIWLVRAIHAHSPVAAMMRTAWGWPIAESLHFIGLCLLIGGVGAFDLRLLGVARGASIAAMHRLIPWGLLGFAINLITGSLFFLTEPDQYVYNPSFHMKLVCLSIAGANAATFYLTSYRRVFSQEAVADAPLRAKIIAAVSLSAWVGVIICGRLLTFYRPFECTGAALGLLLTCTP
jgi:hypothetical protein